ncbi:CD63 antigen [Bactrocera neohumeralis]|uniref:Tetraspanin n=1 Tax=Bactrocera dorsalis TaxID=27457 RepID=A0A034WD08_BACDO|nr:CD63 antigen [Bactrocera tryoni]XP_039957360.1 CD63 antigen [Bactrocera tryoni]XP_049308220.1 CD63 antigen [Bactrocera dorsalis]XP_050324797.1 CD63 antigen [Bactrocera neohumeralis]
MNFKMRTCGMSLVKYILFAFNIIFAISGLGILIAGAVVLADVNQFSHFVEGRVTAPPIVLIVTGLIIFLIASLGCFGAIKESPTLLLTYAVLLAIIFIVELAVGIAAAVFKADLEMMLKNSLQESIKRSNHEDMMAWDNVQRKLMCCGVDNPADWRTLSLNKTLPASCCREKYIDEAVGHCTESLALGVDKYFQEGCVGKLRERIDKNAVILIGVGIGIAFIQILGIILACYLASTIRHERMK